MTGANNVCCWCRELLEGLCSYDLALRISDGNASDAQELHRRCCNVSTLFRLTGRWLHAYMRSGLTANVRTAVIHEMQLLAQRLLGGLVYSATGMPKMLFGMSTQLLLSFAYAGEQRFDLLQALPSRLVAGFRDVCMTSTPAESYFATVVNMLQWKPNMQQLLGSLVSIEYVSQQRAAEASGQAVSVVHSAKSHYTAAPICDPQTAGAWNDGSALADFLAGSMKSKKSVSEFKRFTTLNSGMDGTIRNFAHKRKVDGVNNCQEAVHDVNVIGDDEARDASGL